MRINIDRNQEDSCVIEKNNIRIDSYREKKTLTVMFMLCKYAKIS